MNLQNSYARFWCQNWAFVPTKRTEVRHHRPDISENLHRADLLSEHYRLLVRHASGRQTCFSDVRTLRNGFLYVSYAKEHS